MTDDDYRAVSLRLLDHCGMPWRADDSEDEFPAVKDHYRWDGSMLVVPSRLSASDILHELAHWLYASRRQRQCVEYGLGCNPGGVYASCWSAVPVLVTSKRAQYLEKRASAYGIAVERTLGFPLWEVTAMEHNWEDRRLRQMWQGRRYLGGAPDCLKGFAS